MKKVLIIDDDVEDTELSSDALAELNPAIKCTVRNACPDIAMLIGSLEIPHRPLHSQSAIIINH